MRTVTHPDLPIDDRAADFTTLLTAAGLDEIAAHLDANPHVPGIGVTPRDLGACETCPDGTALDPADAVATLAHSTPSTGVRVYRENVCGGCLPILLGHARRSRGNKVWWWVEVPIDTPAPVVAVTGGAR